MEIAPILGIGIVVAIILFIASFMKENYSQFLKILLVLSAIPLALFIPAYMVTDNQHCEYLLKNTTMRDWEHSTNITYAYAYTCINQTTTIIPSFYKAYTWLERFYFLGVFLIIAWYLTTKSIVPFCQRRGL